MYRKPNKTTIHKIKPLNFTKICPFDSSLYLDNSMVFQVSQMFPILCLTWNYFRWGR